MLSDISQRVFDLVDALEGKVTTMIKEIEREMKETEVCYEISDCYLSQIYDIESRVLQLSKQLDSVQVPYEAPIVAPRQPKQIQKKQPDHNHHQQQQPAP